MGIAIKPAATSPGDTQRGRQGRRARAEEFADLAAYLLSDRSAYVTGSAINLDGGTSPVL